MTIQGRWWLVINCTSLVSWPFYYFYVMNVFKFAALDIGVVRRKEGKPGRRRLVSSVYSYLPNSVHPYSVYRVKCTTPNSDRCNEVFVYNYCCVEVLLWIKMATGGLFLDQPVVRCLRWFGFNVLCSFNSTFKHNLFNFDKKKVLPIFYSK